ncbi:MAG: ABC transporter ATP-binding protein [Deltaproteobacteria bacterium]|jgi:ABC-type multidrug transport system fused ATPase/permease subunit|nr:ABC transporter ATP-binding protein [Deltaproteobacteria bacterium]
MNSKIDNENYIESYSSNVFKTLYLAYLPFRNKIFFITLLGFIARILILAQSNLIGLWVDKLCQDPIYCSSKTTILSNLSSDQIIGILFLMGILGFALTAYFRILFSRYSAYAVSSIYDRVSLRTSRYPMRFFDQNPTGKIITRFSSDYGTVFRLFGGPLAEFISIIFDLLTIVILLIVASPYYILVILFIMALNYLVYKKNIQNLRVQRRKLSRYRSPSIAHFAETTQGASTVRVLGKEMVFKTRFNQLDSFFINQKLTTNKEIFKFSFQMNSLTSLMLFLVGLISYFLLQYGMISMGSIGVAFGLVVYSGNTIQMFFEWLAQLEEGMIGVERLDNFLHKPIEKGQSEAKISELTSSITRSDFISTLKSSPPLFPRVKIKVENLWFRYDPDLPWVLKGLHFEIDEGEKIGIIGRTGSGKTSLIQALFGFYPIEKGYIQLNDKLPIKDIDINFYRRHFAYISQEPVLFQGTLRDNLDPLKLQTEASLMTSLLQVGFVARETELEILNLHIDEKGKNLSLGERQLLCLARTLIQNSPIIILDEATSSVDPQSEEIMVKATQEFFKNRTQIIIAHRLSTLEKCDRVIWLDKGEIKKIGPTLEIIELFHNETL